MQWTLEPEIEQVRCTGNTSGPAGVIWCVIVKKSLSSRIIASVVGNNGVN
jgi:hypothetical protein